MKGGNNILFLALLIFLIIIVAIYITSDKNNDSYKTLTDETDNSDDFEIVQNLDNDFELLGVPSEEPAFQIGFGMGPGLYGTGRQTSEMVGN